MGCLFGKRFALLASVCLVPLAQGFTPEARSATRHAHAAAHAANAAAISSEGRISAIEVRGNERIENSTILSYLLVQPGDPFDRAQLDRSLKTLYATGLFHDVKLGREGDTLIVQVTENPIVNRIVFEGNSAIKDEDLVKVLTLRSRAVYTPDMAQADRQKIISQYAEKGRYAVTVTPQIIRLAHNRVDVVFKINEGSITLIQKIAFVGNHAFSESRLRGVVSSRQTAWWRFFSSSDEYNPDRVQYDRELLRRFYLRNGYIDFNVIDATGEMSPDRKSFYITYTLSEGERYKIAKVEVQSSLNHVTPDSLKGRIDVLAHTWYDGDDIQRNADNLQNYLQSTGYPFAVVRPEIARNQTKHTVDLVFDVSEGPRVYVERLEISGNTRTEDHVIRRMFDFAEGDPFTPVAQRRSKQLLQDMGYFSSVNVDTQPGSAPDRVVVNTTVAEKATGELSLGGGYSTDVGVLGNAGVRQRNLLGTGIDANLQGQVAYYQKQVNFSVTDPYFLGRNMVAGFDLYYMDDNNNQIASYYETKYGGTLRWGYSFNRYLSQSWNYSLVNRSVSGIGTYTSLYIQDQTGHSLLSQIGTTLAWDHRDSALAPHKGYIVRPAIDFAGIGGNEKYLRYKLDAQYFIPLDKFTGDHAWTIKLSAGVGYLQDWGGGRRDVIDNFYLGGDNLRGFLDGGVGPHSQAMQSPYNNYADALGGRFIYTQSTQLQFPLPVGPDVGLSGRYFVDVGGLGDPRYSKNHTADPSNPATYQPILGDNLKPRVSTGVGISWDSPFGLINVDLGIPIVKQRQDQTRVFRFGFGSSFN
ncbi:outer membrane protein assembly factor BamA [Endobacter medicaginis]|uniref:outer membrane protein assembly factor BamA n=1 Tax=Endobacter medicaginis TaxID=1181271 RepID=UPI0038D1C63A